MDELRQEQEKREEEDRKEKEGSWKRMKLGYGSWKLYRFFFVLYYLLFRFAIFGVSATFMGGWMVYDLGSPETDANGNFIKDEFSDLPTVKQYLKRMWKSLTYYQKVKSIEMQKLKP